MTTDTEVSKSRLFLGLILIAIGAAYSLDELGYLDASVIWNYSPLILVGVGVSKMLSPISATGRFVGAFVAFAGCVMVAGNLGWIDFGVWDLWPLIPIFVGSRLILGGDQDPVSVSSLKTASSFIMMGGLVRNNNSA